MLGTQNANQTFYMADRMRGQGKNGAANNNRPLSFDEMNQTGMIIQSNNDSRIHEMLPNVTKQQMFN